MAFAHSLWPQLAALLASLVLWPLSGQAADEGRQRGADTTGTKTHQTAATVVLPLNKGLVELFIFVLIFLSKEDV